MSLKNYSEYLKKKIWSVVEEVFVLSVVPKHDNQQLIVSKKIYKLHVFLPLQQDFRLDLCKRFLHLTLIKKLGHITYIYIYSPTFTDHLRASSLGCWRDWHDHASPDWGQPEPDKHDCFINVRLMNVAKSIKLIWLFECERFEPCGSKIFDPVKPEIGLFQIDIWVHSS